MARVKIQRRNDYSLLEATDAHKAQIIDFFNKSTWKDRTAEDLYVWKFERNPQGNTLLLAGINSEDKIVACCSFMPWKFSFKNQDLGASQWVDMFIDLSYRGQGIPGETLRRGRKRFEDQGAPICFAFPNQNGVLVHKKNNGIHLGSILRYTKPLQAEYLVKRFIKWDVLSRILSSILSFLLKIASKETYIVNFAGYSFKKIEHCSSEFDDFWRICSEKYSDLITTKRNAAYLNWKYVKTPNENRALYALKKQNKVYGTVALETANRIGYIVDMFTADDIAQKQLVAQSIKYFRGKGMDSVVFVALQDNMCFNRLKAFGFVERPEEKHFYIYLSDKIENREFVMNSKNWFITIGDCDIERL